LGFVERKMAIHTHVYVGIDAGSRATKLVAVDASGCVVKRGVVDQSVSPAESAIRLFEETLKGLSVQHCVATGYARQVIPFANRTVTEITCHAKGCVAEVPEAGAVIEIGGQDSKFIALEQGRVHDFAMNDRCAAGTGRFLEVVAIRLGCSLTHLKDVLSQAPQEKAATISSMCVVFAETEIIGLLAAGTQPALILRGVQQAIAARVVAMMGHRRKISGSILFTGGVAQIEGMAEAFEKALNEKIVIPPYPQYTGAYGAALLAREAGPVISNQ
jgi:(R)-2-hydroxyacyl-CoA dehydratese activating ATPase